MGPPPAEVAVCNLLYRYAEMMDSGHFEELADELFSNALFVVAPPPAPKLDGGQMVKLICRTTIRHLDGTPKTKHVITNPIVEVDPAAGRATCRSYYTVFQQTDSLPLQAIVSGRYHDGFELSGGTWRFAERDYTMVDMIGDVSQHLRMDMELRS